MGRMIGTKWEVFDCSPEAMKRISDPSSIESAEKGGEMPKNAKYPFMAMNVGESFIVPFTMMEHNTRQSIASSIGSYHARTARKFTVISHKDLMLIEVARIA